MKKSILLVAAIILACLFSGCVKAEPEAVPDNSNLPAHHTVSFATWSDHYSSKEEMAQKSDLIIVGKLVEGIPELRTNLVFTRNQVEVLAVYSGNVQIGDCVEVLQTGGEYEDYYTDPIAEVPLLSAETVYVLFLRQTKPDVRYGQYYLIMGGYQGISTISPDELPKFQEQPSLILETFQDFSE